jgi:hypothetical protein
MAFFVLMVCNRSGVQGSEVQGSKVQRFRVQRFKGSAPPQAKKTACLIEEETDERRTSNVE